ncbi:MAG: DNA-3-methyladenine glycosylase [Fimbriimonadaceae bacterium]|nr:DNA-3-methyladenine glycosylase [Fimbriimonadaceae bacterium]
MPHVEHPLNALVQLNAVEAAPRLLGCTLVRGTRRAMIVEVEAYRGKDDPGSHSWHGITPRTAIMHGPPGFAYVYFTYGMHWLLNLVVDCEGTSGAILIRAARPLSGIEEMQMRRPKAKRETDLLSGPAKVCAAFDIAKSENGVDLLDPEFELRIEAGEPVQDVLFGRRIGLAKGKGDDYPWRFIHAQESGWASEPKQGLEALKEGDWSKILSFAAGLSTPPTTRA